MIALYFTSPDGIALEYSDNENSSILKDFKTDFPLCKRLENTEKSYNSGQARQMISDHFTAVLTEIKKEMKPTSDGLIVAISENFLHFKPGSTLFDIALWMDEHNPTNNLFSIPHLIAGQEIQAKKTQ